MAREITITSTVTVVGCHLGKTESALAVPAGTSQPDTPSSALPWLGKLTGWVKNRLPPRARADSNLRRAMRAAPDPTSKASAPEEAMLSLVSPQNLKKIIDRGPDDPLAAKAIAQGASGSRLSPGTFTTALHMAVDPLMPGRYLDMILNSSKVNVDAVDGRGGDTALHRAVRNGNASAIAKLLARGASSDIANLAGHRPFDDPAGVATGDSGPSADPTIKSNFAMRPDESSSASYCIAMPIHQRGTTRMSPTDAGLPAGNANSERVVDPHVDEGRLRAGLEARIGDDAGL